MSPQKNSRNRALLAIVPAPALAPPGLVKWGHLVYFSNGPVFLIRVEETRLLFGFWRGKHLRHLEPRLKPGGKYEMATLEVVEQTPLKRSTVVQLIKEAVALNAVHGNPTDLTALSIKNAA